MNEITDLLLADHLKKLKLPTVLREYKKQARQCAAENKGHVPYLSRLIELELIDRERRMVERRIKAAKFPAPKSLDSFDFKAIPALNKIQVLELARCGWIERRENVIALGPSGTGKTHIALGLGLAADHFTWMLGSEPMSLTKLIHYPPTPVGAAGVNAHHDAGFLTVLDAGPTPGLEVAFPGQGWAKVPSIEGGLVINLGENLQAMTGNYLVATPHRVVTADERFSAGYFHGSSLDVSLAPLELDPRFAAAVEASDYHRSAGFMARKEETEAGTKEMASERPAATYGEQLWNYFGRSYPDNMARHHPDGTPTEQRHD